MQLDRDTMRDIAAELVRELVLERAVERALDPARQKPVESGWDLPATDAQMAVLRGRGRAASDLTRGEAAQAIEAVTGERSFLNEDRGWYDRYGHQRELMPLVQVRDRQPRRTRADYRAVSAGASLGVHDLGAGRILS